MENRKPTRWGRLVGLGATTALGVALVVGSVPTANAGTIYPTTTTVTANPASYVYPGSTTLTATVGISVLVTPTGTVTFTADNGAINLGSAQLGNCQPLNVCTASVTAANLLPVGAHTVTASYGGDLLAQPSSASTIVTVQQSGPTSADQTCGSTGSCDTGIVYSSDFESAMRVQSDPASNELKATFVAKTADCTTPGTGQAAQFSSANTVNSLLVDAWMFDQYAEAAQAARARHANSDGTLPVHVCYVSTKQFFATYPDTKNGGSWDSDGYIKGASKTNLVPQVRLPDGTRGYEGLLTACNNTNNSGTDNSINDQGNNAPCFRLQAYAAPSSFTGHSSEVHTQIIAPGGDPRIN